MPTAAPTLTEHTQYDGFTGSSFILEDTAFFSETPLPKRLLHQLLDASETVTEFLYEISATEICDAQYFVQMQSPETFEFRTDNNQFAVASVGDDNIEKRAKEVVLAFENLGTLYLQTQHEGEVYRDQEVDVEVRLIQETPQQNVVEVSFLYFGNLEPDILGTTTTRVEVPSHARSLEDALSSVLNVDDDLFERFNKDSAYFTDSASWTPEDSHQCDIEDIFTEISSLENAYQKISKEPSKSVSKER